jgi:hypothetical protein
MLLWRRIGFLRPVIGLTPNLLFRWRGDATIIVLDLFCVWLSALAIVVVRQARLRFGVWWRCALGRHLGVRSKLEKKPRAGGRKPTLLCDACILKPKCCPNMLARKIARSVHEAARDKARAIAKTEAYAVSRRERKKVEMLFAHLKRILRLGRLRLRGPTGAKDEFLLAATAQNLRKLAKLIPHPAPIFAT